MDQLWRFVGAKSQRDLWKRKVEHIAEEAQSLKDSLDRYDARNQKRATEAKERAELLGRANGDGAYVMRIFDKEAQAWDSVRNSARMLEETNATGEAIFRKYAEQREFLKTIKAAILSEIMDYVMLRLQVKKFGSLEVAFGPLPFEDMEEDKKLDPGYALLRPSYVCMSSFTSQFKALQLFHTNCSKIPALKHLRSLTHLSIIDIPNVSLSHRFQNSYI